MYGYAGPNPVKYVDPDGNAPIQANRDDVARMFDDGGGLFSFGGFGGFGGKTTPSPQSYNNSNNQEFLSKVLNAVKSFLGIGKASYADPKFAQSLERQLSKDGLKSVLKSLKSLRINSSYRLSYS